MKPHNITGEIQLRNFKQINVSIDPEYGIVWVIQNPTPRPCFNKALVEEVRTVQCMLEMNDGYLPSKGNMIKIDYLVLDSAIPGIFSMGGDLNLFREMIIRKDKEGFHKYIKMSIDAIYGFIVGCRLPITTIALVRGDAMGGGFEVALSCQVLIAEKNVSMGFPEVLFNLFPGMGGYHLLSQRIPVKQVEKLMLSGIKYPVTQLNEMGIIDKLVDEGAGRSAVYEYIKESNKHRNCHIALKNVRERVHPISHQELMEVCKYWVEVAMNVSDRDLRLMERFVKTQTKKAEDIYQNVRKEISA